MIVVDLSNKFKIGDIFDSNRIIRHDIDIRNRDTWFYPPGTKCMVLREASYEEWVDYHKNLNIPIYIQPGLNIRDCRFFELSID